MKFKTVTYTKAFVIGAFLQEKIGIEIELEEDEQPGAALTRAKTLAESWHIANNPQVHQDTGQVPVAEIKADKPLTENERLAALIGDIFACKELEGPNGLLTWKTLAASNKEAQGAYDIMLKKLTPKQ